VWTSGGEGDERTRERKEEDDHTTVRMKREKTLVEEQTTLKWQCLLSTNTSVSMPLSRPASFHVPVDKEQEDCLFIVPIYLSLARARSLSLSASTGFKLEAARQWLHFVAARQGLQLIVAADGLRSA